MEKISRAALLRKIPVGTKLTMVKFNDEDRAKRRTVIKQTSREVQMRIDDPGEKFGMTTHLGFEAGERYEIDDKGFTIENSWTSIRYDFGHPEQ